MDWTIDIPTDLLDDEIVCFLADRHHTTSPDIVRFFLQQAGFTPSSGDENMACRLEENEMEMMRGLIILENNTVL